MDDSRILKLNVAEPWFSMEQSGEKKEEYRDLKDYWVRRLFMPVITGNKIDSKPIIDDLFLFDLYSSTESWDNFFLYHGVCFKPFEFVNIKNGWARKGKKAPEFTRRISGICVGVGRPECGASGKNQFIIEMEV